jgi:hypothetical protein
MEVLLFGGGILFAAGVTQVLLGLVRGIREPGWLAALVACTWPWGIMVVAVLSAGVWPHALVGGGALAAGVALGWWWAGLRRLPAERTAR